MSQGRRKAIPDRVKDEVNKRQGGVCYCGCGTPIGKGFVYDHNPALELRILNDAETDTIPPANDPKYIDAVCSDYNKRKTYGNKATTAGSDAGRISKVRRILKGGKTRRGPAMKSKGFDKTLRKRFDGTVERKNGKDEERD